MVEEIYQVTGVGLTLFAGTAAATRYYTDGESRFPARLRLQRHHRDHVELENPPLVDFKNQTKAIIGPLERACQQRPEEP